VPPQFRGFVRLRLSPKEIAMKILLVAALIAGSFISSEARAQRAGDAALGALSGAVVLGPVGAVAGAVVGYTAGPSIARSWGLRRSASHARARRVAQSDSPAPSPAKTAEAHPSKNAAPPVQGFQ